MLITIKIINLLHGLVLFGLSRTVRFFTVIHVVGINLVDSSTVPLDKVMLVHGQYCGVRTSMILIKTSFSIVPIPMYPLSLFCAGDEPANSAS